MEGANKTCGERKNNNQTCGATYPLEGGNNYALST